ncbi:unnamed protein product [Cercospora beticola]|nr:unnamed protein product [Cercospora beticola]
MRVKLPCTACQDQARVASRAHSFGEEGLPTLRRCFRPATTLHTNAKLKLSIVCFPPPPLSITPSLLVSADRPWTRSTPQIAKHINKYNN